MNSARQDLKCDQGSLFGCTLKLWADAEMTTPFDLTDYEAEFRIARSTDSAEPLITLTVGDGLTIATPSNGEIGVRLEPSETLELPAGNATSGSSLVYAFDLIDDDGIREEKIWGSFDVKPRVPA